MRFSMIETFPYEVANRVKTIVYLWFFGLVCNVVGIFLFFFKFLEIIIALNSFVGVLEPNIFVIPHRKKQGNS